MLLMILVTTVISSTNDGIDKDNHNTLLIPTLLRIPVTRHRTCKDMVFVRVREQHNTQLCAYVYLYLYKYI